MTIGPVSTIVPLIPRLEQPHLAMQGESACASASMPKGPPNKIHAIDDWQIGDSAEDRELVANMAKIEATLATIKEGVAQNARDLAENQSLLDIVRNGVQAQAEMQDALASKLDGTSQRIKVARHEIQETRGAAIGALVSLCAYGLHMAFRPAAPPRPSDKDDKATPPVTRRSLLADHAHQPGPSVVAAGSDKPPPLLEESHASFASNPESQTSLPESSSQHPFTVKRTIRIWDVRGLEASRRVPDVSSLMCRANNGERATPGDFFEHLGNFDFGSAIRDIWDMRGPDPEKPKPDARKPEKSDAGKPKPDARKPEKPDTGKPKPDARKPEKPDAGKPKPDARKPEKPDAGKPKSKH